MIIQFNVSLLKTLLGGGGMLNLVGKRVMDKKALQCHSKKVISFGMHLDFRLAFISSVLKNITPIA